MSQVKDKKIQDLKNFYKQKDKKVSKNILTLQAQIKSKNTYIKFEPFKKILKIKVILFYKRNISIMKKIYYCNQKIKKLCII